MTTRLQGCGTALVTPFRSDGALDEDALRAHVRSQLEAGINILVPCGTTGEAVTLTRNEHIRVVEITADEAKGRVPVIAGAGSNDTKKAIELSRDVKAAGATHLLQVTPMYNKPPQRALVAHFRAIADGCDLPIVLYNVPSRTSINLEARACLELAADPRFVAVKEASGNFGQITTIIRERPDHFAVLSGDDASTLPIMAHGGDGVVSVVSNIAPALMVTMCMAMLNGRLEEARKVDERLAPLYAAAFVESNPIPAKAMLALMKRMGETLRLPLVPLADQHRAAMQSVLQHLNLLS